MLQAKTVPMTIADYAILDDVGIWYNDHTGSTHIIMADDMPVVMEKIKRKEVHGKI